MSHSGDYVRQVAGASTEDTGPDIEVVSASNDTELLSPIPTVTTDRQLDWHGPQRAPRGCWSGRVSLTRRDPDAVG
jgi:phosphopantetheinyl transferase